MNGSEAPIARNTSVNGEIVTNAGRNFGGLPVGRPAASAPERIAILAKAGPKVRFTDKDGLR